MVLSSNWSVLVDGKEVHHEAYEEERWERVKNDYESAFYGLWEGKVTRDLGDETNDELHRWECMAAGTYAFYDKVGDKWVEAPHYLADYFVDGTLLCTRWQDTKDSEELRGEGYGAACARGRLDLHRFIPNDEGTAGDYRLQR